MTNRETACSVLRSREAGIMAEQENLNAKVVQLDVTIKRNFEEPGI